MPVVGPLQLHCSYHSAAASQGKGEFTMEYSAHLPVTGEVLSELTANYKAARAAGNK